ncbi:hypothetical protein ACFV8Z_55505 [Streptomyces sp. NPDC059837]|uniref:hypothetical protein n=1 Tax=unclassified Streptomyces TaxID=2593676 RepID=UPI003659119C
MNGLGELSALRWVLGERRRVPTGTPILLDEAMRPVEPLSSWFRVTGQQGLDAKTMRAYAYTVLRRCHVVGCVTV